MCDQCETKHQQQRDALDVIRIKNSVSLHATQLRKDGINYYCRYCEREERQRKGIRQS